MKTDHLSIKSSNNANKKAIMTILFYLIGSLIVSYLLNESLVVILFFIFGFALLRTIIQINKEIFELEINEKLIIKSSNDWGLIFTDTIPLEQLSAKIYFGDNKEIKKITFYRDTRYKGSITSNLIKSYPNELHKLVISLKKINIEISEKYSI